ncbi:Nucleotidyl transferase AbiEii toxin, Type IV TA system [Butyrivibrio fibrisolvens DSM 3071]|uniref:Nucleotidyl transferase AbiEii toxin, Type IV TA system n=1 Tax=Butyrivibrio fibrisolvens DSM 3071 TaxID=1121131 RepID=A0A1M6CI75_BUTFI|nr:nucleotidyl transferase AbiEii/AbiGii toxin family protein [Butyrivibrio fibrisolvens]SHI60454.1 Nucleotidyl transferase AbiEii toxin, Type IV TA system [Butyrivibrio fibrisolvens DSM 3071]
MSWYKDYKREWKEIIETISREVNRTPQMIEKDTIQSMFLLELSKSELPFVFKGGTSLSKGYGLIDRFSEDLDLSMNVKPTESDRRNSKSTITEIANGLGLQLENPEDIHSRHSYNKYVYEYESLFSEIPLELIVETSFYQSVYPVEKHEIKSFVGDFCKKNGITLPIPFEAASVEMNLQSLERTFIDKVFAICDYRIQDMQDRDSRHLYDIAKILPRIEINKELDDLIDEVRNDRMLSKNNPSAQLEYNIPKMLHEIIDSRFYESDYNNITRRLLYENVSYDEAINKGIAVIADMDVFEYKK